MRRVLAPLVLGLALAACQGRDPETKDYAAMNTIPLKTVCIGRLQVDLPQKAMKEWRAEFDRAEVTRLGFPVQDKDSFWAAAQKRKQELESLPHETEPNQLGLYERVGEDAAILLYRDSDHWTGGYKMDRYLWLSDRAYKFESGPWPNEIKHQLDRYSRVFTQLVPHDAWDRPQTAGFCIDGATVTGRIVEIDASVAAPLLQWPKAEISIGTGEAADPSQIPDTEGIDERLGSAIGTMELEQERYREMAKAAPEISSEPEFPKEFDVLRQGARPLGSRQGEAAVWRKTLNNGAVLYKFLWINSEKAPSTPDNPSITLEMTVGDEYAPDKKPPPEEEMIALWDAVLASLKPRAGS